MKQLVCHKCGKVFLNEAQKKYCSIQCQKEVQRIQCRAHYYKPEIKAKMKARYIERNSSRRELEKARTLYVASLNPMDLIALVESREDIPSVPRVSYEASLRAIMKHREKKKKEKELRRISEQSIDTFSEPCKLLP